MNHTWEIAKDQKDTGTQGMRIYCGMHNHSLTILRSQLKDYGLEAK